ncbi:two-component regulator propeller domain-containing protein [Pontibacter sp. 13R65]|uniref:hybrid sensor histidine kinase/response regulator n=1 Tax=Pontibacter sp. 13R65 TaxID=3127458 RepID=UPI00301CEB49
MKKFYSLIIFLLYTLAGLAQSTDISFRHLTTKSGLSQSFVRSIVQDQKGFIWIGTSDGLNKYDGYKTKVYRNNPLVKESLSTNAVIKVFLDKKGTLYIGTDNGGLNVYNQEMDNFTVYRHDPSDPNSLSDDRITSITEDYSGLIWIATDKGGLNIFNRDTKTFTRLLHNPKNPQSPISNIVRALEEDQAGNMWIGTEAGISVISKDRKHYTHYKHKPSDLGSLSTNSIRKIFVDTEGEVWIGTAFGGLNRFLPKTKSFKHYIYQNAKQPTLLADYVPGICQGKDGRIWIATNYGLSILNKKNDTFTNYQHDSFVGSSLLDNGLNTIYADPNGNIWIGSIAGISIKEAYSANFEHYVFNPGKPDGLGSREVSAFYQDKKDNIWIGLRSGFDSFNPKTKKFRHHEETQTGRWLGTITSFYEDTQNNLWLGTFDAGVMTYDRDKNTFEHYVGIDPVTKDTMLLRDIWHIQQNPKGELFLATLNTGIFKYNPETRAFYRYGWKGKKVPADGINSFYIDKAGTMWLGTTSEGVYKINEQKGIFKVFRHDPAKPASLSNNIITTIYEDRQGRVWIGTRNGLNLANQKYGTFRTYSERHGLPSNTINSIQEDEQGNLWLGTNEGLSCFNPDQGTFQNFRTEDGLQLDEFLPRAALKLRSGELLFGGLNGFNKFNPATFVYNKKAPAVYITDFQIFNKEVPIGTEGSPLKQAISEAYEIKLSHKQSVLSFGFVAINYTRSKKNQYAYMLEGFDTNWNYVGSSRKAYYTNLDPGEYVFRVKASNNDGVWNETGSSIKLIITPPYWATWWFRTLMGLSFIGLCVALYKYRLRAVNKQKQELEEQVKARTSEVILQKEALQTQAAELKDYTIRLLELNTQLHQQQVHEHQARQEAEDARQEAEKANHAKSTFLATMSHEIRTPLNGVIGMTSLLSETKLTSEQRNYTEIISSSGKSLLSVIDNILDFSKIEAGNLELEQEPFDLREAIEEVLDMFASKAAQQNLDLMYQLAHNTPIQIIGDSVRLKQILINLVGNAVKFTSEGEIFVGVTLNSLLDNQLAELSFEVRDTGIGIPDDKAEQLFKAFMQVDSSTTRKYGGTGLGLAISKRLVELMGGNISVESTPGKGTTFRFSMLAQPSTEALQAYVHLSATELKGKSILVVDDNRTNRSILKAQLTQWSFVPLLAESAQEAIDILERQPIDIVISDMHMPETDGVALAKKIKKRNPQLPIILLSSIGDSIGAKNKDLFYCTLTKPVKHQQLYKQLSNCLKQQQKTEKQEPEKKRKLSENFANKHPMQILVAEDYPINQMLAHMVLEKLGYTADLAENGLQVLEALNHKIYDVILMDVQMPEMDGLAATRAIRGNTAGPQPYVIATTANAMKEDVQACLGAGMDDYISKPIDLEDLLKSLEKAATAIKSKTAANKEFTPSV